MNFRMNRTSWHTALLLSAGLLSVAALSPSVHGEQTTTPFRTATALSKPSEVAELSMPMPGIALNVAVKEGDRVKTGQLLIQQDSRLQESERDSLKLAAESDVSIRAAQAKLGREEVNLEKVTQMSKTRAASDTELRDAALRVDIARLELEAAIEEQKNNLIKLAGREAQLDMMRLTSKFDGIVAKNEISTGEVIDPQKPAIIVVKNDPLYVETNLPTSIVSRLKVGQIMEVTYAGETRWVETKIEFIQPVANSAADLQMVRMVMPNPENRDSGLQMLVKLPGSLFEKPAEDQNAVANP